MKSFPYVSVAVAVVLCTASMQAQGGCVDSPENSTAVLFLVGGGAVVVESVLRRLGMKGGSKGAGRDINNPRNDKPTA